MIRVTDSERLRTVTLARPERRNALTPEMLDELADAVADPPVPVVYLRGAGSAFCAGADLDSVADVARETLEFDSGADANAEGGRETGTGGESGGAETNPAKAFARHGQRTARAVEDSPAVVVAGIDGPARGGGVELALACDLRVATPEATFAEPGVTFGLFGAWGGTHRLVRVVGEGNAADLSLTGRSVDAEEALRMGLVSQVRPDPVTVAEAVADNDPSALARLKPLLRGEASVADREGEEVDAFAALVAEHGERLGHRNG
ncbi:enoyl-CoA hydratase/isomerase family protein [Halomarina litorea]|uniref:enoyl-CoA hydratase/isomerase family protein n=1 Tax=Halomarina litorea TaxID=2961595 RepID=UPI0020C5A252|nr:enoyl-CoA hydratase/isomerase family protein [Halomarina sp. BCD28]